jgi:hypothetical protein
MRERAHPGQSFVSEVYIYRNNHYMIAIVALRPYLMMISFLVNRIVRIWTM